MKLPKRNKNKQAAELGRPYRQYRVRQLQPVASERRAKTVAGYLRSLGLSSDRIAETGFGESIPVADNNTVEGRRLNRRVEIGILADENLKEAAEKGKL